MTQYIPITLTLVCVIWTLFHWPRETDLQDEPQERARFREFLVLDIRANSQYCSWYVTLIGVIATVVASSRQSFEPILTAGHLWPFGVAFLAASICTLFLPAGYGPAHTQTLRWVWLRSVVCEQVVVMYTCYGIWDSFSTLTGR